MKALILASITVALLFPTRLFAEQKGPPTKESAPVTQPIESMTASEYSKGQISFELGGAGLWYSLFGSYRPTKNVAANFGFGYISITATAGSASSNASVLSIPLSVSYLVGETSGFLELLAGMDGVKLSGSAQVLSSDAKVDTFFVVPELGVGYRYWPVDGGFHFRATLYVALLPGKVLPWPGLTFGVAL